MHLSFPKSRLRYLGLGFLAVLAYSNPSLIASEANVSWKTLGALALRPLNPSATIRSILGRPISLSGFMVADEFNSSEVTEFLLMPVSRGCPHVPPPPPSYVVHAKTAPSHSAQYYTGAVVVRGILSLTKIPDGALGYSYEMAVDSVEPIPHAPEHFNY